MTTVNIMTRIFGRTVMTLALMLLTATTAWADVEINETNFPDAHFRYWLQAQSFGSDNVITDEEIAETVLLQLDDKGIADLTGIAFFTALTDLDCEHNQLTKLDVSHNTALKNLLCRDNQLTSLNVSNNPHLESIDCSINNLTSLNVSSCTALSDLYSHSNRISGEAMDNLIAGLPTFTEGYHGHFYVVDLTRGDEYNVISTTQVAAARAKNWIVQAWMPYWQDYAGVVLLTLFDDDSTRPAGDKNTDYLTAADGQLSNVTLQWRTLYIDGDWNTLCLPFNVSNLTGTPLEGFTVKELDTWTAYSGHKTGVDGTTLYLNFKDATGIEAGKPYIVKHECMDAQYLTFSSINGSAGGYGEGAAMMFDGKPETKWCTNSSAQDYVSSGKWTCFFTASNKVSVTGYTLTTGNDTGNNPDRNPRKWKLYGREKSNGDWQVIDSRDVTANPSDALPEANMQSKSYALNSAKGPYMYFKLEVSESGGTLMQLSELTLQGSYKVNLTNPTFTNVTIDNSAPTTVTSADGTVSFTGSYSPVAFEANDKSILYLGAANKLYWPNAAMTLGACRAYFKLSDGGAASAINLYFDDGGETTEIKSIDDLTIYNLRFDADKWYTLNGVRLSGKPTQKGVYIHNGRKEVIQ